MKRSAINAIMRESREYLERMRFLLPPFAFWTPDDWRTKGPECREIVEHQLGWDITDFGSGEFNKVGLFMFTIRNGRMDLAGQPGQKPYAEKVLIVRDGQITPIHCHDSKIEDIINRGGGRLALKLWNRRDDGGLGDGPVRAGIDGVEIEAAAGETIELGPGESITLPQRLYHTFWGVENTGTVLVGEVSSVNDDRTDNVFHDPVGRFADIEEDEPPLHLLYTDYPAYYRS